MFARAPKMRWAAVMIVLLMALPGAAFAQSGAPHAVAPAMAGPSHSATLGPVPARVAPATLPVGAIVPTSPSLVPTVTSVPYALVHGAHAPRAGPMVGPGAPALRPAQPGASSTGANWWVAGSDCSVAGNIVQWGTDPNDLLQEVDSPYGLYNGTAINGSSAVPCSMRQGTYAWDLSSFVLAHGGEEVARSTDAGQTWTPSYLNQNSTLWANPSSPENSSVPVGNGQLVASVSGSTSEVFAETEFQSLCLYLWNQEQDQGATSLGTCNYANDTEGVAVAASTDGGASWGDTHQIVNYTYWKNLTDTCSDALGPTNFTENPSVAVTPVSGGFHLVAVWSVTQYVWIPSASCTSPQGFSILTYESQSSDSGVHWSTPKLIGGNGGGYAEMASVTAETTSGDFDIFGWDWSNGSGSAPGAQAILWSRSTNSGASWTTKDIPSVLMTAPPPGPANTDIVTSGIGLWIDTFGGGPTLPVTAVDNWSSSTYHGRMYVAWVDNQTGSLLGNPAIDVISTSNSGSTWSSVVTVPYPSGTNAYNPAISVDSDGVVWVSFYDFGASTGYFREFVAASSDGGATFSQPFPVADSTSIPGSTVGSALHSIGERPGLVGTSNGTFIGFTDCRLSNCTTDLYTETYVSQLFLSHLETNVTELNASTTTYGDTTPKIDVKSTSPGVVLWANGASHNISVPFSVPYIGGEIEEYNNTSGLATGTNPTLNFNTVGPGYLYFFYVPKPAATIAGTFCPNVAQASLTINSQAVPLHPAGACLSFSDTLPGGTSYPYSASAGPKYTSVSNGHVGAIAGQTTTLDINLSKTNGTLTGSVSVAPGAGISNTAVTLNGTAVPVNALTGAFSVPEPWGYYFLNASNPRTTAVVAELVTISPGLPTAVPIALAGGWIQGNVVATGGKYTGLVVTINDSRANVTVTNSAYNWSCDPNLGCPAGWYWVNATEPGYNTSSEYVQVIPGQAVVVNLDLTNTRVLTGQITPLAVAQNAKALALSVEIINQTDSIVLYASGISPTNGTFTMTVRGGVGFNVIATATGYKTFTTTIPAYPAGATSPLVAIAFVANTPNNQTCANKTYNETHANCTKGGGGGGGTTTNNGLTTLDYAIIGVVVLVAIVALALIFLMRRRGGGDATMAPEGGSDSGGADSGGETYGNAPAAPANDWSENPPNQ
ncbi:MAG TPA: hypothetical protein VMH90_01615 [Thermoplasmata archaeon]|nr:hypothetical protein [Thermoplasmata archaeon]